MDEEAPLFLVSACLLGIPCAYDGGAHPRMELIALAARGRVAILKQRSPSCGASSIYDGTHSGRLVAGQGVTAALLRRHNVAVWSEEEEGEIKHL